MKARETPMTSITLKSPLTAPAAGPASAGAPIQRVRRVISLWRERARQRRHLRSLDAGQLDDIGVSAEAAAREGRKPFWRG